MFNKNEIVIYKPPHQKRGLPIDPIECEFKYIDKCGDAVVIQTIGPLRQQKRRTVNPKYLFRKNEI